MDPIETVEEWGWWMLRDTGEAFLLVKGVKRGHFDDDDVNELATNISNSDIITAEEVTDAVAETLIEISQIPAVHLTEVVQYVKDNGLGVKK